MVSQKLQVRVADHGEHRDIRAHDVGEPSHLAEVADAHLHHGNLMGVLQAQQRPGHAELVVEVLFRLVGVEAPGEHRRDHLLGGGLAHRASDADHGNVKAAAMPRGEGSDGAKRGIHDDAGRFGIIDGLAFGDTARGAAFEAPSDEVVSIHPRAPEGHKQRAGRDGPAVAGDGGHLAVQRSFSAEELPSAGIQRVPQQEGLHAFVPLSIASSRIAWHSVLKSMPTAAASWGMRLVGVMPGSVLISRKYTSPCSSTM